jgi:hypothetical protein
LPVDFFIGSAPCGAPGILEGISAISTLQFSLKAFRVKLLFNKQMPDSRTKVRPQKK